MTQAIVGGLTSGAIYALVALGIVTVFRFATFLNLAQGEFYVYGALIASTLVASGWPVGFAVVGAVLATSVIGAALYWAIFRHVRSATHAMQLLTSLGVALAMAGSARLFWGTDERSLPEFSRADGAVVFGAQIGTQVLVIWAALAVLCLTLWFVLHRTLLGVKMQATASSQIGAALLGVNVKVVGLVAFALAAAIGAVAGVTVAPQVFVNYDSGLLITVLGFVAAAVGGMTSVRGAVLGGLGLGVLQAVVAYQFSSALKTPIAFAVLILVLVVRSGTDTGFGPVRRKPMTSTDHPRLELSSARRTTASVLGQGRIGTVGLAVVVVFALAGSRVLSPYWLALWTFIGVLVLVGIGLDLLLGCTGQLSLGQTAFMGVAAYMMALSEKWWGVHGWLAVVIALTGVCLFAALLGLAVLRLRGYYFALATLATSLAAVSLVSGLPDLFGGPSGLRLRTRLGVAGHDLSTPSRLFVVVWIVVAIGLVVAGRLMRSRFGQAMVVVGVDETAASASAVSPFPVRLKVFVLSAGYAGAAGVLLAQSLRFVSPTALGFQGGLDSLVGLLLGGFGTLWGAVIGVPIVRLLPQVTERFADYQQLVYGATIVVIVLVFPDGIVGTSQRALRRLMPARPGSMTQPGATAMVATVAVADAERKTAPVLEAIGLTKSYGGVRAVDDVHLVVNAGQILGLIGPNGAGKSTCLGLLAGTIPADGGTARLMGNDVTAWPAHARAAAGLARTFQLPRLIGSQTVLDTVALGAYRHGRSGLIRGAMGDLGWRERTTLRDRSFEALELVGLDKQAARPAQQLSTGQQKLLELAGHCCSPECPTRRRARRRALR